MSLSSGVKKRFSLTIFFSDPEFSRYCRNEETGLRSCLAHIVVKLLVHESADVQLIDKADKLAIFVEDGQERDLLSSLRWFLYF